MSFVTKIEKDHYLRLNELGGSLISLGNKRLNEIKGTLISSDWKAGIDFSTIAIKTVGYNRKFSDIVDIIVSPIKQFTKDMAINLGLIVSPTTKNDFIRNFTTELELDTPYSTVNAFVRAFSAKLEFSEKHHKDYTAPKKVPLDISILKVSNAGQIINEIRFYSKILNETNFDETFTPYGYSKWKHMITGDYIYEKAMCKYVMQASLNADRPNTRVYKHKVDVPDVTDRGTISLTVKNQPFEVHFSKDRMFHIVPEVNTTIKSYSGTDGTPIIIPYNVTTKGFMLIMKNTDGGYVEGSVTYAARGY